MPNLRLRWLALSLAALGAVATLGAGWAPAEWRWPVRLAVIFVVPMIAGVVATLWLPRSAKRLGSSARVLGTARFHLVIAAAVLLDLAVIGLGYALDWATFTYGEQTLEAWKKLAVPLALPFTVAVATLGTEWALHARLWEVAARERGAAWATTLAVGLGVGLALPGIAPGFVAADGAYLLSALVVAALNEATALALFRSGGLFVAGAYRGTLLAISGFGLADWSSFWFPLANYVSSVPAFYALRAVGPLAALLFVAWATRRRPESA